MRQHLSIVDRHGNPFPAAAMSGDYELASTTRRLSNWGLSASGPNAALSRPLHVIRSRVRSTIRNNPIASGMVDATVANLIGTDISPRWESISPQIKEALQQLWSDSQEELDYSETYDFYGQQEQVGMAQMDAGEALARFIPMPETAGLLVPLQIQLLEADHLDASYNTLAPNGNEIRMGIEWNKQGKREAYWIFIEHPGELHLGYQYSGDRVRIPASDMLHIFRPTRINQARGCPWLASGLVKLHEIDQLDDAVLVRKKIANLFSVFFTSMGDFTGVNSYGPIVPGGMDEGTDSSGRQVVSLEPGMGIEIPPGKDVKFANPPDVGDNYKDFIKQELRAVARGLGITYEQISQDFEGVTFSSARIALNEYRRLIGMLQQRIIIHQFCRPVIRRWLDTAVLSGAVAISAKDYLKNRRQYWRIRWMPQGWDYVDPVKDRIAEQMDVRNGFDSRTAVVARRSRDIEKVDQEIADDNARADKHKLILDSDPRHTEKSGAIQSAESQTFKESVNE